MMITNPHPQLLAFLVLYRRELTACGYSRDEVDVLMTHALRAASHATDGPLLEVVKMLEKQGESR